MVLLNILHSILEAVRDFFFFLGQDLNWLIALLLVVVFVVLRSWSKSSSSTNDTAAATTSSGGDSDKPRLEDSQAGQFVGVVFALGIIALAIFITEKGC